MSVISGTVDWNRGLIWQVGIAAKEDGDTNPSNVPQVHASVALVDTGASRTCISATVVSALGLSAVGKASVNTAAGVIEANLYDVHVLVQVRPNDPDNLAAGMRAEIVTNLRVMEFTPGNSPYDALIGMDILRRGLLTLSHDGHFSFAL